MALTDKAYVAVHDKTGGDLVKLKDEFDAGYLGKIAGVPSKEPALAALVYQIGLLQDEIDYLRTEISSNKDNRIVIGSSTTVSFGDMITVPPKGKTPASYSVVMTVANGGVSKSTTLTLT